MLNLCLTATCTLLAAQAPPADGPAPRVAVMNISEVFDKYEMTKGLEDQFERQRQTVAERAQARRDDMDVKRRALLEQFKPDSPEFAERQEELERLQTEYDAWLALEERRLKREHKHWLMTIYRNVREQARQIAESRNVDVVLTFDPVTEEAPDSQTLRQQILLQKVIYSSPRCDITRELVDRLNQDFQKRGGAPTIRLGGPEAGKATAPAATPEKGKPADKP